MKIQRIVLFFLYAFSSFIVPFVVMIILAFATATPPYTITSPITPEAIPEGVTVIPVPDGTPGSRILDGLLETIPRRSTTRTPSMVRYTRSDTGTAGEMLDLGSVIVAHEGADRDALAARREALPFLTAGEPGLMYRLVTEQWLWLLIAIFVYLAAQVPIWLKIASWAGTVARSDTAPAASREALLARLQQINQLESPLSVEAGRSPGEVLITWKFADHRWAGIMHAAGLKSTAVIRLRLDPRRNRVLAQDRIVHVRWKAGAGGRDTLSASLSMRAFKGIVFAQVERGTIRGISLNNGRVTLDPAYTYQFSIKEMRTPLIDIITSSGWDYVPVATFLGSRTRQ